MDLYQAIIAGIVQGLTEFLPISSSGHLVLLQSYFNLEFSALAFDLYLHIATLAAVIIYFRKDIIRLITRDHFELLLLVLAMVPAGIISLIFGDKIEAAFENPLMASVMLLVTGLWLCAGSWYNKKQDVIKTWVTLPKAVVIGCAQAAALFPGISRSGSTIATGLLSKIKTDKVISFSFLLSILAISAGSILKFRELSEIGSFIDIRYLIAAMLSAFICALVAIKTVIKAIHLHKLYYFGIYCFIAGIINIIIWLR